MVLDGSARRSFRQIVAGADLPKGVNAAAGVGLCGYGGVVYGSGERAITFLMRAGARTCRA